MWGCKESGEIRSWEDCEEARLEQEGDAGEDPRRDSRARDGAAGSVRMGSGGKFMDNGVERWPFCLPPVEMSNDVFKHAD